MASGPGRRSPEMADEAAGSVWTLCRRSCSGSVCVFWGRAICVDVYMISVSVQAHTHTCVWYISTHAQIHIHMIYDSDEARSMVPLLPLPCNPALGGQDVHVRLGRFLNLSIVLPQKTYYMPRGFVQRHLGCRGPGGGGVELLHFL